MARFQITTVANPRLKLVDEDDFEALASFLGISSRTLYVQMAAGGGTVIRGKGPSAYVVTDSRFAAGKRYKECNEEEEYQLWDPELGSKIRSFHGLTRLKEWLGANRYVFNGSHLKDLKIRYQTTVHSRVGRRKYIIKGRYHGYRWRLDHED